MSRQSPPAALLLAAGRGTRMRSSLPKVLHQVGGMPLILHSIRALVEAGCQRVVIVVGHGAEDVEAAVREQAPEGIDIRFALQAEQLGTGHAALMARKALEDFEGDLFILPGDVPLVRKDTLVSLLAAHRKDRAVATVLTTQVPEPSHYGRIVRDEHGLFLSIVEAKDASPTQLRISEINTGAFVVKAQRCFDLLAGLSTNNAQGEYYLTDLVELARQADEHVLAWKHRDHTELMGINNRRELAAAEARLRRRINDAWMDAGVTFVDPDTTWVSPEATLGPETIIEPGAVIAGPSRVGRGCLIEAHASLRGATVADGVTVGAGAFVEGVIPPGERIPPLSRWPKPSSSP